MRWRRAVFPQAAPWDGTSVAAFPFWEDFSEKKFHKSKGAGHRGLFSIKKHYHFVLVLLWSLNDGSTEGRYLPIKNKWFRHEFLKLAPYGWEASLGKRKTLLRLSLFLIATWARVCSLGAFKRSLSKQMPGFLPMTTTHGFSFHQRFG